MNAGRHEGYANLGNGKIVAEVDHFERYEAKWKGYELAFEMLPKCIGKPLEEIEDRRNGTPEP